MTENNARNVTRIPQLTWLLAFKSVAEHGSFTVAARDLHLSQPAVSQRISKLEDLLKTLLFFRNSKVVKLTDSGKVLLSQIQNPFDEIMEVLESYQQSQSKMTLMIETEPVWNKVILSPQLPRFLTNHPNIVFRQALTTDHLDFTVGTQLAVKWGEGKWEGFDAQFLSGLEYFPVCSPEYLVKHKIETPDDLAGVRILHERDYADWNFWLKYHPCKGLNVNNGHVVGESNILMSLAMSGVGVALCGLALVSEHIKSGALVMPLPTHKVRHYKAYYILTRKNQKVSSQAKSFIEFLHEISLVQ